ncbi:MAG TPA: glycosyltransferase [Fimbriimonadaceae bacterium]|jgi:tetratricopeptide (TPR) repeat protein
MNPKQIIEKAHQLVGENEYGPAQELLLEAVGKYPEDIDLNAETGIILCYGQKEFEAVDFLVKCDVAERQSLLANLLRDYFYCRNLLAQKVNVIDDKGAAKAAIVAKYSTGKPENIGIKLSASLIVKNEEKHLDRCLASIKDIVDEIVVVDTGSTDSTIEIAEKYGAKIGHFEWCDDFGAARNASLELCTGNWVLWIDADEALDPESFGQMREAVMRPQFGGYFMKIINFMEKGQDANTYVHTAVRLFRNIPEIRFTGRIHEQIIGSFKDHGYVPATLTKGVLHHFGYQHETMVEKNKLERTINMLKKEVAECPQEPFHWFNLANAYSVAMMPADAEQSARKCVEIIDGEAPYGPATFQILCSSLTALERAGEALYFCNKAIEKGYDTVLNEFEKAHACLNLKNYDEGLVAINRCMEMEWPIALTGDFGIKTYKGHILRGQILCDMDRFEESEADINYALSVHPGFPMALFAKAVLCERLERYDEAFDSYLACADAPGMWACKKMAGRVATKQERHLDAMLIFQQAFEERPTEMECWHGWAQACLSMKDLQSFAYACETIGEERIPSADFLVNWGRALAEQQDLDGALAKFGAAISRAPENANAYFNCGDLLYQMGHFQEAAEIYQLGLQREPANADAWFVLGNCFAQLNIPAGAKTSYTQALVIAPEHSGAKHNLEVVAEAA